MYRHFAALVLVGLAACTQGDTDSSLAGKESHAQDGALNRLATSQGAHVLRRRGGESFARMPDRGELLAYAAKTTVGGSSAIRDGAYTWHRIEISEEHAFRGIVEGRLRVPLPTGEVLDVQYDRHEESPTGDWTWIGSLPGHPGAQTILTFGERAVFGSVGQVGQRALRVTTRDGVAWAVETDPQKLVGLASAGANPSAPDYLAVPKLRPRPALTSPSAAPDAGQAGAKANQTIDLVIGYTQGFVAEVGNASAANTRLTHLVAVANTTLVNSQVSLAIRAVHRMQVNYTDASSNSDTLQQMTGYDADAQQFTTPNAAFNGLRAARDQYGADLVTLVRGFRDPDHDGCGIAWLLGGGRSGIAPGSDYFGYSVVSDGTDINEGDGETYFCRDETMVHEIGHNLGSQHDRETAEGGDNSLDDEDYGVFTYSFGLKTGAGSGNFFTVMAYGDEGQTDYRVFSNPDITFCGGHACGTTQFEDNARSLGQTAPVIAAFRATVVSPPTEDIPQGVLLKQVDINGNKRSDIFFYNHAIGRVVLWFMNGLGRDGTSSVFFNEDYRVIDSGDFNADGRSDLLLTSSNRDVVIASSTGFSLTFVDTGLSYSADQQLIGLADVNGDGRSDILVRNATAQNLAIWYMNGVSRYAYNSQALSSAVQYVGSGDLDGNGRQDLLWKDAQNNVYTSISTGTGFVTTYVGLTHAASFELYGLHDINGDGRSDMVLHDQAQRRLVIWFMNGNTRYAFNSHTTAAGFRLVGKGDFDGNRRGDLLLQNPQTRQLRYMLSSGSAFALALLGFVPQSGYQVMDLD